MPFSPHDSQDDFPNSAAQNADPDHNLIQFLRQHTPPVPCASPDLEERLMLEVKNTPRLVPQPAFPPLFRSVKGWVIPSALVVGMALIGIGYSSWKPAPSASVDAEVLEAFLQENWDSLAETAPQELEELF